MTEKKSTHITWHPSPVSRKDRAKKLQQTGATLWLTGLSGSGKSTIAVAIEEKLHQIGKLAYRLDGDNIRHGLNANLSFSEPDRIENIRRISHVAKLFADAGLITLVSFISPYQKDRDTARQLHQQAGIPFIEIHIHCPLDVAQARDPKGLYKKAKAGQIKNFTGISAPYQAPTHPQILLNTHTLTIQEASQQVLDYLNHANLLQTPTE